MRISTHHRKSIYRKLGTLQGKAVVLAASALGIAVTCAIVLALLVGGAVLAGGPFFVSPAGNDANDCLSFASACHTINGAITKAVSNDIILIAAGTYTENLALNKNLTLIGFGPDATIINGGGASNIVVIAAEATAQIDDVTLMNPYGQGSGGVLISGSLTLNNSRVISMYGPGLLNSFGILNVNNTIVRDNFGTGIGNEGSLTVTHSTISHNYSGGGGGIGNYYGTALVSDSLIMSNSAYFYGGGIYNDLGGVVTVVNSTIISNAACGPCSGFSAYPPFMNPSFEPRLPGHTNPDSGVSTAGGGIFSYSGVVNVENSAIIANSSNGPGGIYSQYTLTVRNSTISNNVAPYGVGGIESWGVANIVNSTISENRGDGGDQLPDGIWARSGSTQLKNTILANPTNCGGQFTSLGHNLSSDATCAFTAAGDLTNTNPLLGPLQDNGGPTPTHALLPASPAINHGDNAACPPTDQRGIARPQAGLCDIGAYEYVFPFTLIMPIIRR